MTLHPIVLSGGAGTRLWPLSRELYPKQFLPLVGKETLFQQTIKRVDGLAHISDPIVVCNESHRFLVSEQIREFGRSAAVILLEPVGRSTAPALMLAALWLIARDQDALMLTMPADIIILHTPAFHAAVEEGIPLAESGQLVTFGVTPIVAATGYGYIRGGEGHAVAEFVEKPNARTAQRYLDSGGYLWNSGIFLMRASTWIEELERHRLDIASACQQAYRQGERDGDFYRPDPKVFFSCPSDSIDYAVMEKTDRAAVVPLKAGWTDLGDWSSLEEVSARDDHGNVLRGDVVLYNTKDALLFAQHRLLAAVGVSDLIVVETADAVLVAQKGHTQDVKLLVQGLQQAERSECQNHRKAHKPWGFYEVIDSGERFKVKRITVNPGAALSLQMHKHRAEHWVVVKGVAKVTRAKEVFTLGENQSTYIPLGVTHRLENPGKVPLELIEVQSGNYLEEDDIIRFEDGYGRITDTEPVTAV